MTHLEANHAAAQHISRASIGEEVASPKVDNYTLVLSGSDSPELQALIRGPRQVIHQANDPHVLSIGGRELVVGPVYVINPEAVPINADDAAAALEEVGELNGIYLKMKAGCDRYFYPTLADRPLEELYEKPFFGWGLIGIEQPDVEFEEDSSTTDAAGKDADK